MQFAFTEEQELLRREARDALANGGAPWTREELGSELGFLDQAVLFEELGRAGQGESFFDAERPREEQLATRALEAHDLYRFYHSGEDETLALRGVKFVPTGAAQLLRRNLLIYGAGGVVAPFIGIKLIDLLLSALGVK